MYIRNLMYNVCLCHFEGSMQSLDFHCFQVNIDKLLCDLMDNMLLHVHMHL